MGLGINYVILANVSLITSSTMDLSWESIHFIYFPLPCIVLSLLYSIDSVVN